MTSKFRRLLVMKLIYSVLLLAALGLLFPACQRDDNESEITIPSANFDVPFTLQDCVWLLDSTTGKVAPEPFCFSRPWSKIVLGDVLAHNSHIYVTVTERWNPEKGLGQAILELDPDTSKVVREIEVPLGPQQLLHKDGIIYVSSIFDRSIVAVDLKSGMIVDTYILGSTCPVNRAILGSDANVLYATTCSELYSIDLTSQNVSKVPVSFSSSVYGVAVTSTGYLYLLLVDSITVIDPFDWNVLGQIRLEDCGDFPTDIWSSQIQTTYVTCQSGTLIVLDQEAHEKVATVSLPNGYAQFVAESDGKIYIVDNEAQSIAVIDIDSNTVVKEIIVSDR